MSNKMYPCPILIQVYSIQSEIRHMHKDTREHNIKRVKSTNFLVLILNLELIIQVITTV